jgi:hypothetical protein
VIEQNSSSSCPSELNHLAAWFIRNKEYPSSTTMNRRLRSLHTSSRALAPTAGKKSTPRYNFNTGLEWEHEAQDTREEGARFRRVTAREVKGRREEGRRVRMLVRDWVDDSLYNVSRRECLAERSEKEVSRVGEKPDEQSEKNFSRAEREGRSNSPER